MSIIETLSDVNNTFLSRRELTCNFAGLAGKLKKLEAVDMISKEFNLGGKVIIPLRLRNQSGKSIITGTFYVYDDEVLAKKHVNLTIFSRLEKSKAKKAEPEKIEETPAESKAVEGEKGKSEAVEGEKGKSEAVEGEKGKSEAVEGEKGKSEAASSEGSKEEKSE